MTNGQTQPITEDEAIKRAKAFIEAQGTSDDPAYRSVIVPLIMLFKHDEVEALIKATTANTAKKHRTRLTAKYHLADDVSDDKIDELNTYDIYAAMCPPHCSGASCLKPFNSEREKEALIVVENGHPFCQFIDCRRMKAFASDKKIRDHYKDSKIPIKRRYLSFDNVTINEDNRQAFSLAKQAIKDGKTSLYIFGSFGVGKTTLASIIANESVKLNRNVIFAAVPKLLQDIKSTFDSKASSVKTLQYGDDTEVVLTKSTMSEMLKAIIDVPVLILDDFGAEAASDWSVKQLSLIINERYDNDRQTIFTSNFSLSKLAEHLGQQAIVKYPHNASPEQKARIDELHKFDSHRIMNRILEMCQFVEIKGKNWRQIKKCQQV